ncbi:IclR family transcriptional regulator [Halegenticoccus soli]|uniref:IclR family transcriptional regulator n=1 Tax=Halegenticoccus soli TaxID=1985678 RepID=UPI000C6E2DDF|nr:IclR family transcriptional regulator [Halegenticoccus soli]
MTDVTKNPIKATRTTFSIVEVLVRDNGASVTEVADSVGLAKSSVHNYLSTLREMGYVTKEETEYHVGLGFLELGEVARNRQAVYEAAKPEMRRLAERTGELVNLLVEEAGRGIFIHREVGERGVTVDAHIGQRVYLHSTAVGKAILAHLPADRVRRILDQHGLPAVTEQTIVDRRALRGDLERIRERGVAFDREERRRGLRCVAAPIRDGDGGVEAAISVSGPANRMRGERFERDLPSLLENAADVIALRFEQ